MSSHGPDQDQDINQIIFDAHKPIRNRIRQYDGQILLDITLSALLNNEKEFIKNPKYLPWECMLLIRWIFQYSSFNNSQKRPTVNTVNELLNGIRKLYDLRPLALNIHKSHALNKFMRRMAFQQFSYQMPLPEMGWRAGRQLALFIDIGKPYKIAEHFQVATGVSIEDFLSMSFAIFSILQDKTFFFKEADLNSLFSPITIKKYLDLVSITPQQAKIFLDEDSKKKKHRFILQLYEVSPLVKKPFLKIQDKYFVLSKRLFRQFFAYYIYDFLYETPSIIKYFGKILEKYIREQLEILFPNLIPDKSWEKILGKQISAPDFTISQNDATIFIESKSKHLAEIPKIMQTNDALSKHLDDSIVKGVVQIYSLANEIKKSRPKQIENISNLYGIVVSFKPHHLRGGQQFWDEFLSNEISTELKKLKIEPNLIPAENIFLLSIDEFDYLVSFLKKNSNFTLNKILSKIKAFEATPEQQSFFFQDHLEKMIGEKIPRPEHLWQRMVVVIDKITDKLKTVEKSCYF